VVSAIRLDVLYFGVVNDGGISFNTDPTAIFFQNYVLFFIIAFILMMVFCGLIFFTAKNKID
jgi:hypothetical protein